MKSLSAVVVAETDKALQLHTVGSAVMMTITRVWLITATDPPADWNGPIMDQIWDVGPLSSPCCDVLLTTPAESTYSEVVMDWLDRVRQGLSIIRNSDARCGIFRVIKTCIVWKMVPRQAIVALAFSARIWIFFSKNTPKSLASPRYRGFPWTPSHIRPRDGRQGKS